ncbi:MAG: ABC transporter ATP-binding protein [Solirubrobacteraceae bacterium]
MSAREPVLEIAQLTVAFPARRSLAQIARREPKRQVLALDGVSLTLFDGETLGIVGESGSGKSTLAKAVVGLVRPNAGAIRFRGVDLAGERGHAGAERRRIQLIFQDPYSSLNPRLRVGEAIGEPARVHKLADRGSVADASATLLQQVGLPASIAQRRPRTLSGGQRQRVAIARALAARPDVLLADEAVSALDVSVQAQIVNLLADLQCELGLSIVFVSHQLAVVEHLASRVAVMYLGRIVEIGATSEVFANPAHPYTRALLAAQPGRHRRGPRAKPALKGEIPSPLAIPSGCRFRTRCPLAQEICAEVDPREVAVSATHAAWCHFATASAVPAGGPVDKAAACR